MRFTGLVLAAAMLAMAAVVSAQGNPEQGSALYATCASCHGARGEGNATLNAPRLSHLPQVYIAAQLKKFKSGARGSSGATDSARQMAGMAATLADEQAIDRVAQYITTLSGAISEATIAGNVELGRNYYNQFCGACHGPEAGGNPALNSPPLAGSDDWYLAAQLRSFRAGERGTQPQDKTGKQMRMMATVLPDDEAIDAVIAYIDSLAR